tara:strand:+ start:514 stop:1092 length:579 start_codon:yes stop_codon:yes gene_type:complete
MALPLIALPAFLTLVRQVGINVAKRAVKGRLAKDFLTKNKNTINKANEQFIKNTKKTTKKTTKNTTKSTTTTGGTTTKKTTTGTTKPGTTTKTTTGTTKPGTKAPAFIVAAGTIGGGAALMTGNKDKSNTDKKSGSGDMTFKQAFAKARKEKGKLATFTYKGKSYSTATEDDYKKAGYKSLREYLNAMKKKK